MLKPNSTAIWATINPSYVGCSGCSNYNRLYEHRTGECHAGDCPRYDEKEQEVLGFMDKNSEMLKLIMWEIKQ